VDAVYRSAAPHDAVLGYVDRLGRYANAAIHPSAVVTPGVVVYRLDDRLFFANAEYFRGRALEAVRGAKTPTRWLVLDAECITDIDASGVDAVQGLVDDLDRHHIGFVVARLKNHIRERFDATGLTERIQGGSFQPTVQAAVAHCVALGQSGEEV
jgi:MFS superfamily sulfate permease-like transporter